MFLLGPNDVLLLFKLSQFLDELYKKIRKPPQIVRPQSAFIIVDVQNDFISGSLAIINCPAGQNGEDVR